MSYIWLHVDVNLPQNHKTARLARYLGCSRAHAVGHLVCLWSWAMIHAPGGDLSHLEADDIADLSGWDGDADLFMSSLERAGLVDAQQLHEWEEHQGQKFRKRVYEAEKKRRQRDKTGTPWGQDGDTVGTIEGQKDTSRAEQSREEKRGEEEGLAALAASEIPSDSNEDSYRSAVRRALDRGLSAKQVESVIYQLADWWPTRPAKAQKRTEAHRTLQAWLLREEPKRDPPTEPTYPDIVVPEDWS